MEQEWIVEKEEAVFKHPFMQVNLQQVRLPDQTVIPDWPIVNLRNYINVVVLDEDQNFLIIKGYKHGIGRLNWQILGGYIDPGEDALTAAKRELMEETGLESHDWTPLGTFIVDANRRASEGTFFIAKNCKKVAEPDYNDLEDYAIEWHPKEEVAIALHDGRIAGMSYAAPIAMALLMLD